MTPEIRWSLAIGPAIRVWSGDEPGFLEEQDWEGGDGLTMEAFPSTVEGLSSCSVSVGVARQSLLEEVREASGLTAEITWWWRQPESEDAEWVPLPRRFRGRVGEVRIAGDRMFFRVETEPYLEQSDVRRWTHSDQQVRHPGDDGLRRVDQYAEYGFAVQAWLDSQQAPVNS